MPLQSFTPKNKEVNHQSVQIYKKEDISNLKRRFSKTFSNSCKKPKTLLNFVKVSQSGDDDLKGKSEKDRDVKVSQEIQRVSYISTFNEYT